MMAKDSVKNRISGESSSEGMSFTEFTYQLVQGYDFLHLYRANGCTIQMGGSDQWGNITTGTELIIRIAGGKGYAITCPLITKSDGSKFGKSEGGNVWLDANRTSPYKFYQYWLNSSDEDAERYIKIFTFLRQDEINAILQQHKEAPHLRVLQKCLAEELVVLVHSKEDVENALKASQILFSNSFKEDIKTLSETVFLDVFEGVKQAEISRSEFEEGLDMIGALAAKTDFLASNGDARRALKENAIAVNKEKVKEDYILTSEDLINDKYIVLSRGKKTNFILKVV
jgi:tyrosyl-tRNA synthetase